MRKTLPAQNQNGLARKEGTEVDPLVIHPQGWRANRTGSEIQVPGNLAEGQFQPLVRVLSPGEHAGPEGHVAKVPTGGEVVRVPGPAPDVPYGIAGAPQQPAAGVSLPRQLGVLGVVHDHLTPIPLPNCPLTLGHTGVVSAAQPCPSGKVRRLFPHLVGMDEVGMGKGCAYDGGPCLQEVFLQHPDGMGQVPLMYLQVQHAPSCGSYPGSPRLSSCRHPPLVSRSNRRRSFQGAGWQLRSCDRDRGGRGQVPRPGSPVPSHTPGTAGGFRPWCARSSSCCSCRHLRSASSFPGEARNCCWPLPAADTCGAARRANAVRGRRGRRTPARRVERRPLPSFRSPFQVHGPVCRALSGCLLPTHRRRHVLGST